MGSIPLALARFANSHNDTSRKPYAKYLNGQSGNGRCGTAGTHNSCLVRQNI
jgi:hypothetical protein